jgi:hypothetical protein
MGKGSKKRKCQVSREVEEANWKAIFGEKKLNIMSNKDREEMWRGTIEEIDKIIKEDNEQRKERI